MSILKVAAAILIQRVYGGWKPHIQQVSLLFDSLGDFDRLFK